MADITARFLIEDMPDDIQEDDLRLYFEAFGELEDVTIKVIRLSNQGSIKFATPTPELKDELLRQPHEINGHTLTIKTWKMQKMAKGKAPAGEGSPRATPRGIAARPALGPSMGAAMGRGAYASPGFRGGFGPAGGMMGYGGKGFGFPSAGAYGFPMGGKGRPGPYGMMMGMLGADPYGHGGFGSPYGMVHDRYGAPPQFGGKYGAAKGFAPGGKGFAGRAAMMMHGGKGAMMPSMGKNMGKAGGGKGAGKDDSITCRYIIEDLEPGTTEDDLRLHFEQFSEIEEVTCKELTDGRFSGSVKFANPDETLKMKMVKRKHTINGVDVTVMTHKMLKKAREKRKVENEAIEAGGL